MDVHSLIQDLMLVSAVSVDALIAAFSYGAGRIRIPAYSAFIISFICSLILTASIILSSLLGGMIPDRLCRAAGAGLLTVMGTVSLFQNMLKNALRKRQGEGGLKFSFFNIDFVICVYLDETKADCDSSKTLSAKEAVTLALALSADSLASGFGAGTWRRQYNKNSPDKPCCGIGFYCGRQFFRSERRACKKPRLSRLSGAILIILGLFKYIY